MKLEERIAADLAPTGVLSVALNLGNPLLVKWNDLADAPVGITVDLATKLSQHLSVCLKFICFPGAGKVFEAANSNVWDIAFLAVDPARSKVIYFTNPYVTLSGSFAVRAASAFTRNGDTDSPGVRIVVGKGSAYDLYLSSTIMHAEIVRVQTSEAVLATMVREGYEVAAGVRQALEDQVRNYHGLRLLDGRFMAIHQAMAVRKDCTVGFAFVNAYVEEMKASGFIERALLRHGVDGVSVAAFA